MEYDTLTAVSFRHVFFAERKFDRIAVKVSSQTAMDMRRHALLLKQQANGFLLLYDTDVQSREELLREKLTLVFDLELKDPLFYNYTADLSQGNITKSILLFSNNQLNTAGTLHHEKFVSGTEVYTLKPEDRFFVKPFGRIVLELLPALEKGYEIHFAAKAIRWRYFLMSEQLAGLSQPAIVDATGKVRFGEREPADIPGKTDLYMFTSEIPLELSLKNKYAFQLVDDTKVVISTLPTPDISKVSSAVTSDAKSKSELFSEIFLY
jgi:hypothetical protein